MHVRDVLKAKGGEVFTIPTAATVADAVALLVEHNIGSLPVVADGGRLVGIFTERDVLRGVDRDCGRFLGRRVDEAMTPEPVTCTLDCNVHDVMGKMTEHRVGQLPVVRGDAVVGLVSIGDVVRLLFEQVESENRHLLQYLYGPA